MQLVTTYCAIATASAVSAKPEEALTAQEKVLLEDSIFANYLPDKGPARLFHETNQITRKLSAGDFVLIQPRDLIDLSVAAEDAVTNSSHDPLLTQYPMPAVVAFALAVMLLFFYILFLAITIVYNCLSSRGHEYLRVHEDDLERLMPSMPKDPPKLPEMPRGTFAHILSKGKEKIPQSHGKPVL